MQEELTKEFATDLEPENTNEKGEALTAAKSDELGAKISEFTMKVMRNMAQPDPATGRTVIRLGGMGEGGDFELELQKEKDLFYLAEGFTVEQVTRVMKENRAKLEANKVADMLAEKMAAKKQIEDGPTQKSGKGEDEGDWEDVEEGKEKDSGVKIAKTVEIE